MFGYYRLKCGVFLIEAFDRRFHKCRENVLRFFRKIKLIVGRFPLKVRSIFSEKFSFLIWKELHFSYFGSVSAHGLENLFLYFESLQSRETARKKRVGSSSHVFFKRSLIIIGPGSEGKN